MKDLLFIALLGVGVQSAMAQAEKTDSMKMNVELGEVTVAGQRKLARATGNGLVYDLRHDKAAQGMNLLEALRRVPLVTVSSTGEIKVKGSGSYFIYLNGKPYHIAQRSPRETLSAIPASTIESVEVITLLDGHYDAEAGEAVINIITAKNALDGYLFSLNGNAYTQPKADAGATLMANKGKVSFSAGYSYDMNMQLEQPGYINYEFLDKSGATAKTAQTESNSDGLWTNHLARTMMEWAPDTLNSLYADGHALIKGYDSNAQLTSRTGGEHSLSKSRSDIWQGTAEANLIYRNYYPNSQNQDRLTLGYRFTYNPDKRSQDYDLFPDAAADLCLRRRTNTDGRLLEHTFRTDYALPIGTGHTLRFGAKEVLRHGDIESEYLQHKDFAWQPMTYEGFGYAGGLTYTQNVAAIYASYSGRVKKVLLYASLRGEYNHNSIELAETGERASRNFTSLIPRLSLNYSFSQASRLTLSYSSSMMRPTIAQLNPFVEYTGQILGTQGNPCMKPSRTQSLGAQFSRFWNKLFLQASLTAAREHDAILQNYSVDAESGVVLVKYGNFGHNSQLAGSLYANYRPRPWLSLTASWSAARHWLDCPEIDLRQGRWSWTLFNIADFTLPHGWVMNAQYVFVRNTPQLWSTLADYHFYSFYINKAYLGGRLTIGLAADRPFNKFTPHEADVRTPFHHSFLHIDMRARSIGVKIAYTLSGGKKVSLRRDTSLVNEDMETGVK